MSDINKVVLIGRLTSNPESRVTQSGVTIASFTLASGRTFLKGGTKEEQTGFFDVVAWNKLGETVMQYCKKGDRIAIDGRLTQQRWEKDDKKHSKVEITMEAFQFLTNKKENPSGTTVNLPSEQNPFVDDNIPF